jgi:uncharacterized heparinase superfamily protein
MTGARSLMGAVARIGPNPDTLVRYGAHKLRARGARLRLRRGYPSLVVQVPTTGAMRAVDLQIPAANALPPELGDSAARIRSYAEETVAHRFDILGSGATQLGDEIDWHTDFKSGYRWPEAFYQDIEVTRLTDSSDAKVPWELSRGHHLLGLARAARLFGDQRYRQELERQFDSWLVSNPPGVGINWANAMEVGIRAVNWVWALRTLGEEQSLDPELHVRVTRSLQSHGRHIAANLEGTPYLRSNHFLSDILGLLTLGWVIEGDPAAARWLGFALQAFEHEIRSQVYEDGVSFEASVAYHGLALEIFALAAWIARAAGQPMSADYHQRLARMVEASRAWRRPDGLMPQFGDNDSGRVLPLDDSRWPSHDPIVWLASAVLRLGRPFDASPDPEIAWNLGLPVWERTSTLPVSGQPPAAFESGGLYVLRGRGAHCVVRCGGVGQNGNGGHSHNDVLSYELAYGRPYVVDSGTYVYTSDPPARNAFRATAAHNTIELEGEEINPIAAEELFRLRGVADPVVGEWHQEPDRVRLAAGHGAYRRLPARAQHRRTFELDRIGGGLEVRDLIEGNGTILVRSRIHLAPGVVARPEGQMRYMLEANGRSVTVAFDGFGSVEQVEGWVSERYGVRAPAQVLVGVVRAVAPIECGYTFAPMPLENGPPEPAAVREVHS